MHYGPSADCKQHVRPCSGRVDIVSWPAVMRAYVYRGTSMCARTVSDRLLYGLLLSISQCFTALNESLH